MTGTSFLEQQARRGGDRQGGLQQLEKPILDVSISSTEANSIIAASSGHVIIAKGLVRPTKHPLYTPPTAVGVFRRHCFWPAYLLSSRLR